MLKILVSQHDHYNYMDAGLIQGLQNLGHEVWDVFGYRANYLDPQGERPRFEEFELIIDFVNGVHTTEAPRGAKRIFVWGEDDQAGLDKVFAQGYDHVFVRDHILGSPGIPINFGIEDRYYCATSNGIKPLKGRTIDVCFLGSLWAHRLPLVKKLKQDFGHLNLMLGPRRFNTTDDTWSRWTKSWCAHDPQYFETLADSKICLSFKGAGPDTARTWECLASGAVPIIETMGLIDIVRPTPGGVRWFFGYDQLREAITETLARLHSDTTYVDDHWKWNQENHSTTARARYVLNQCGLA
jgi:hypothetical protein